MICLECGRSTSGRCWQHSSWTVTLPAPPMSEPIKAGAGEALEFRRALWLGHGHFGVYGDDGEMQCGAVGKHGDEPGPIDFKRDTPLRVVRAALGALLPSPSAPEEGEPRRVCKHCRRDAKEFGPVGMWRAQLAERDREIARLRARLLPLTNVKERKK